jgi:predicted amidohydrolase
MVDLIAIQLNSSASLETNLKTIETIIARARPNRSEPALVVLPECASQFGCGGATMLQSAEQKGEGKAQAKFAQLAKTHNIFLVAGTMPIIEVGRDTPKSHEADRYCAASLVYAPSGECISQYNKIHLFDVEVADNTKSYFESKYTEPGRYLAKFDSPWGQIGQAVCYDLRFAKMFDALMPMNILVLPSAFTLATGSAHWHALLKARSIELQCFVVAANQVGKHEDGRQTFGHSCIYSPWGELLSVIESGEGWASARFDETQLHAIRTKMPISTHKQERYGFE